MEENDKKRIKIFFASAMRPGAISRAPYGVYCSTCESPQPFSAHYSIEEANNEAMRLNHSLKEPGSNE